ncbi:MAG: aspartate aminotransferase family protein [Cardiobacteriaceae bacterium]|nr:aspartate aminotransferase family protein [Cardiobacteriaceae bacterium]
MTTALMNNYKRQAVNFVRGEGVYLYDDSGKRYLDGLAGIAVCGLGHAHPELVQALAKQAQTLWHVSNAFEIPGQESVARTLCQLSGMERAFFCNSGTEANEAALKLTRLHARQRNIEHPLVLTFQGSFHGRTFGAMSATGNAKIRNGFEPLLDSFAYLPYNDLDAVKAIASDPNIVAVMLEGIQGEGGIHLADRDFVRGLRELCDKHGWLLIFDEIQAGLCRTGKWFNYQHHDILPDIVTLAKGLGNGMPVGACLARGQAAHYFQPGMHGTTFGGNPLAMRIVEETLAIYQRDNLCERARTLGDHLRQQIESKLKPLENIVAIRGQGLMVGIELARPIDNLVQLGLEHGIVFNVTADKVIRLLPALVISEIQIDEIVEILQKIIEI